MTRVLAACAAIAAAGCLDKPPRPPGGSHEYRPDYLVGDFDRDGSDDLLLWGHDGDPRQDAKVFMFWGGGSSFAAPDELSVKTGLRPDAQWYEVTAVASFFSTRQPMYGLVVLSGEDSDPRPGDQTRYDYVSTFSLTGRVAQRSGVSGTLQSAALGGYADAPSTAFAVGQEPSTSAPNSFQYVVGNESQLWTAPEPIANETVQSAALPLAGQEYVMAATSLPNDGSTGRQDLFVVTTSRAFVTSGDGPMYTTGLSTDFPGGFDHYATRFSRGTPLTYAVSIPQSDAQLVVSWFSVGGGLPPSVRSLAPMAHPFDAVEAGLVNSGEADVVTIEPDPSGTTVLRAYLNLQTMGPALVPTAIVAGTDDITGYDMVIVGNFFTATGPEILLVDHNDPTKPMLCYKLSGNALVACP